MAELKSSPNKERPILFKDEMVRAILDGSKTQTRRVIKPLRHPYGHMLTPQEVAREITNDTCVVRSPYGQVGNHLWVRETMSVTSFFQSEYKSTEYGSDEHLASCWVKYSADGELVYIDELSRNNDFGVDEEAQAFRASKKKSVPSIHMPRWASRITLEIVNIRVERLKDISEADAVAEGVKSSLNLPGGRSAAENFKFLWEVINGEESWSTNPWVWVIEFKRIAHEVGGDNV